MLTYKTKLNENGRIIIPAALRKQLDFKTGEELIIYLDIKNEELHISSLKNSLKKAQMRVQKYAKNKNLVEQLKKLRKEDSHNE